MRNLLRVTFGVMLIGLVACVPKGIMKSARSTDVAGDEAKFQSLTEREKIAQSSDIRICAFATENGSWTMQQRWRGYIYEAQRRGLNCGVGQSSSRQLTQNERALSSPAVSKPAVSKPAVPETQNLNRSSESGAERTIARYETQFGPSDDAESFENNLVMKFCKTGLFVDDFVYLWIRSGSVVTVKKETGSTPGSCSKNYKVVDWNGTVSQGFLVLKANSKPSSGGWNAVAEEFLIQQQNSQQELNNSLMDSFRNNRPGSTETLERNRSIDCMGRGGAYVGGVCRFN